ncbi:hypothetical protein EDD17DRAFT_1620476 [Pisolithus thermaeus]|nr:hypothetical protein EDD17DRAFT_1620476 [Pisolithus thermaeus]
MSQETETVESLIRGPLIGTLVGLILYGVTSLRAFFYFRTYVDDRMGLRLLVYGSRCVVRVYIGLLPDRALCPGASITVCNLGQRRNREFDFCCAACTLIYSGVSDRFYCLPEN